MKNIIVGTCLVFSVIGLILVCTWQEEVGGNGESGGAVVEIEGEAPSSKVVDTEGILISGSGVGRKTVEIDPVNSIEAKSTFGPRKTSAPPILGSYRLFRQSDQTSIPYVTIIGRSHKDGDSLIEADRNGALEVGLDSKVDTAILEWVGQGGARNQVQC